MRRHSVLLAFLIALLSCRRSERSRVEDAGAGVGQVSNAVAGCTGKTQPAKGSCLMRLPTDDKLALCTEFTGSEYTTESIQQACAGGAQYSANPCPPAGLVGKCIDHCGESSESAGYVYQGTPEAVKRACLANNPPGYFVR